MDKKVRFYIIVLLLALTGICLGSLLQAAETGDRSTAAAQPASPFPPALEISVPFEPTAFASNGKFHLFYEIYLRNFETSAIDLTAIEVLDANGNQDKPVAVFGAEQLPTLMNTIGDPSYGKNNEQVQHLGNGASAIVYMELEFNSASAVPASLRHRIRTRDAMIEGAVIGTHHDKLPVLSPPLEGRWYAETGPANDHGHRRGLLVFNGQSQISRRYAFDWMQMKDGAVFAGDKNDNASYFAYGEKVLAVADARVAAVTTGVPTNVPGRASAVPMTLATMAGNSVTLDLGDGQYARYMHMQPGSVSVHLGDAVRRGQVIGLVGNSGSSFSPHLHFEVTTTLSMFGGEGAPYLIDEYRLINADTGTSELRKQELPLNHMTVEFRSSGSY